MASLTGCSGKRSEPSFSAAEDRLYTIGKAYIQASSQLNRGPKSYEEIQSFVPGNASQDLLNSPNDGEPFVILWGVDFNKLPPGKDPFYVGAYEKTGSGGKRVVLRFPIGVVSMTEAEFRAAVFPPGHQPPP